MWIIHNPNHDRMEDFFGFSDENKASIFLHVLDVMMLHDTAVIAPLGKPGIANMCANGHKRDSFMCNSGRSQYNIASNTIIVGYDKSRIRLIRVGLHMQTNP
jgi:hypothetical protein